MEKTELKEKREKNIRQFKLDNGRYVAEIHSKPIHYLDEAAKEYKDCDCTLHESGESYISGGGNFRVKLPKNIGGEIKSVGIYRGGADIKWEYLPDKKRNFKNGRLLSLSMSQEDGKEMCESEGIVYPEVCRNVDLKYEVNESEVKEKIIIKGKKRSYNLRFLLKLNGYTVSESDNGKTLIFNPVNEDDENSASGAFRMNELYMFDNNEAYSYDVSYSLEETGDGEYILTIVPDKDWIESENRRFPITIDPSLEYTDNFTENITSRTIGSNGSVLSGSSRKVGFESGITEYRTYDLYLIFQDVVT